METIKATLKRANDYFVQKLMDGDFEIEQETDCHVTAVIDGQYKFMLWCANTPCCFRVYEQEVATMDLKFNNSQKIKLWNKFQQFKMPEDNK